MTENALVKEQKVQPSQIGIKVLIYNTHGEVLLLKRNPDVYGDGKDYWDVPGGRVANTVDVTSIAKGGKVHPELTRELQEEIGWTPDGNNDLTFVSRQQITTSANESVDRFTFALQTDQNFDIRLSPEHTEYKWVAADELKTIANLGDALRSLVRENKILPHHS